MWCSSASASASDDIASSATAPPSAARKPLRSMSIESSEPGRAPGGAGVSPACSLIKPLTKCTQARRLRSQVPSQRILLERSHTLDLDPRIVDKPARPKRAASRHAFLLEEGPVNRIHVSPLFDVRQHHRALDDVFHRRPVLVEVLL